MTRWGIIGAGNIAHRFCESLKHCKGSSLYAISGRNQEKLDAFASQFQCEKIYIGYENLLMDENVDAVYIALPHHLHAEWIIKAAEYGKDILCEKPAVLNQKEALAIKEAVESHHVIFMEAMKNLFTPAFQQAFARVKEIGKIHHATVQHGFVFPVEQYDKTYHTQKESGGCLYDVGCYGLGFLSAFLNGKPAFVKTYANLYHDVDLYVQSQMLVDQVDVTVTCAFDRQLSSYGILYGEHGSLKVYPVHRPDHYEITVDGVKETVSVPYEYDDFYSQIAYFENLRNQRENENTIMPIMKTIQIAEWSDGIRKQFLDYTEDDLKILEEQEKVFEMEQLCSADALALGNQIVSLLPEYDRGISCQIVRESDAVTIFQYVSDDKKQANLNYADRKHQACKVYGHSSAWVYVASRLDKSLLDENHPEVLASGGSFPICNHEGKLIASVLISGLHEGKDHELIIRVLCAYTGKEAPLFSKAIG